MVIRVHVGVDESGPSRAALVWAARFASESSLPLVLEHVVDGPIAPRDSVAIQEHVERGETLLRQARAMIEGTIDDSTVTAHVLVGEVTQALAHECGMDDLLVIGTHKTGFLRGRAFGARAVSIAASAPGSVAVIPEDHRSSRSGVIVAVPSTGSNTAVDAGLQYASHGDHALLLVAAADEGDDSAMPPELTDALRHARAGTPVAPLRAQSTRRYLADALLDLSHSATLLVLQEPRSPHGSASITPLNHDVLLNINCPVMIVR